jgi:hypothetical protein
MPALDDLASYSFEGRNETAIREDWIRPLLEHLGYGVGTLNRIEYEASVRLREPVRLLGHTRLRVDYLPTVLGRNLWLIEAKAPGPVADWPEHLGQAWSYATHPEVDVPLMVVADGSRIAVYDVTHAEWDTPVVDIASTDLSARFAELHSVLGARKVADFLRRRQLHRLSIGLRAEIDPSVLDATSSEVAAIVAEARPYVQENRKAIAADQAERDRRTREAIDAAAGIFGMAQELNGPFEIRFADVDRALALLLKKPANQRAEEFANFLRATQVPAGGPQRPWWNLRVLRLGAALRIRGIEGCGEFAEYTIREAVRDHLLGFPDDPLARAAHRLERPLPVVMGRLYSEPSLIDLRAIAAQTTMTVDEEMLIRRPVSGSGLAQLHVNLEARRVWNMVPWSEEALVRSAKLFEGLAQSLPDPPERAELLGWLWDPASLRWDGLIGYTLIFLNLYGTPQDIPEEGWTIIHTQVDAPGKVGPSARALITSRQFTSDDRSPCS